MADGSVIGVRLPQEDTDFLDALAEKNMSYRGTVAKRLLQDKIEELRALDIAAMNTREGEESLNGNPR